MYPLNPNLDLARGRMADRVRRADHARLTRSIAEEDHGSPRSRWRPGRLAWFRPTREAVPALTACAPVAVECTPVECDRLVA